MRHSGTIKRFTIVHLFDTEEHAEECLRKELDKVSKLSKLQRYGWTSYMGSYDTAEFRVYFMTIEKFEEWKKRNVYDDVSYDAITVKGDDDYGNRGTEESNRKI